jgi:mitogen-activated protein kinase kinase
MANRVSQSSDIDAVTAAFKRVSLGAPTSRTPSGSPQLHSIPAGMAARRNKPVFKLSDITGEQEFGGGGSASAGGNGEDTTTHTEWPPRRPVVATATSTPFANFGKIVYAP